jgi:hypothetical protein
MTKKNASPLIDVIFGSFRSRLLFEWAQEECLIFPGDTKDKPLMFKPLRRVWVSYPKFSSENTILVDDSPAKTLLNPRECFYHIPTFSGDLEDNILNPKKMALFSINRVKGPDPEGLIEIVRKISVVSLEVTKDHKLKEYIDYVFNDGIDRTILAQPDPTAKLSKYISCILLSSEPSTQLLLALVEVLECFLLSKEIDILMADVFEVLDRCNWLCIGNSKIMNFLGYTPKGGEEVIESIECSEALLKRLSEKVDKLEIKA